VLVVIVYTSMAAQPLGAAQLFRGFPFGLFRV
jgi:hypothetical protein